MTQEEIYAKLQEILKTVKPKLDPARISMDAALTTDLGIDSLSMLLLSLAAEEKFQMHVPDGAPAPTTVGEVCDAVLAAHGQ